MAKTHVTLPFILFISSCPWGGVSFVGKNRANPAAVSAVDGHAGDAQSRDPMAMEILGRGAAGVSSSRRPCVASVLADVGTDTRGSISLGLIVAVAVPIVLVTIVTLVFVTSIKNRVRVAQSGDGKGSSEIMSDTRSKRSSQHGSGRAPTRSEVTSTTQPLRLHWWNVRAKQPDDAVGQMSNAAISAARPDAADEGDVLFPLLMVHSREGSKFLVDGEISNCQQNGKLEMRLYDPPQTVILNLIVSEGGAGSGILCEDTFTRTEFILETSDALAMSGAQRPAPEKRKVVIRKGQDSVPWAVVSLAGTGGGPGWQYVMRRTDITGEARSEIMWMFPNAARSVVNVTNGQNVLLGSMNSMRPVEGRQRRELRVGCGADALLVLLAVLATLKLS